MSIHDVRNGFSRRGFLSGATILGALTLIPGLLRNQAFAATPDGEIVTGSHWGVFRAKVAGGRFVEALPWPTDPAPTPMLEGIADSVYSASRIKYPMVRKSFLEKGKGSDRAKRGGEEFVRVSWDKAVELVAAELARVKKDHGNKAIYAGSYGWKSVGKLHNARTLLARMMNLHGGYIDHIGDYSTGASQVIMPHVVGTLEVYEQQTAWPVVVDNSQLVVLWGADPMVTNQIDWILPDHGGYAGFKALKEKGTKVICIDPVRTESCKYLNAEWIAPKPQTDVAMMLGIAHTLMAENLHDAKFLKTYTTGFDRFADYLNGKADGQAKTAEWAAGVCGIPADLIKDLARRFAKNRTMLMSGWSMQRMDHGEQAHWMLVTLASMLGQIGLPGGGFGLSYHYSNGGTPSANSPVLAGITATGKAVEGAPWLESGGLGAIPLARIADMLLNPGKVIDFNGKKITYPDIKLIYWVGGNPFAHHQDTNTLIKAWQKPETIIVHEIYWTPTARHADIVLPATTSYERNDIEQGGSYSMRTIAAMHKVVDPLFEAKSDYDIFDLVSRKLGYGDGFSDGKSEIDWIKSFYDAARKQAEAKQIAMPDFDTFWNKQHVLEFEATEKAKKFVRHGSFREDPLLNPLGTPSGKIEIYSKAIEKMGYDDCPPHPKWMEPVEWMGGPVAQTYPLHVSTSHPKYRLHSQLASSAKLRAKYTIADREPCLMNPKDAAARGLKDGDVVRIFNGRGQILAGVKITDDVRPGVIRVNEGGWYDPAEGGKPGSLDKYGCVNVLTVDKGTSKLAQGNCGHTCMAQVEKYAGKPAPVGVYSAPANA